MAIWESKHDIHLGNRWKFVVLVLLVVMFAILIELAVWTASIDPILPIIFIIIIVILVPVTAFVIELYFATGNP